MTPHPTTARSAADDARRANERWTRDHRLHLAAAVIAAAGVLVAAIGPPAVDRVLSPGRTPSTTSTVAPSATVAGPSSGRTSPATQHPPTSTATPSGRPTPAPPARPTPHGATVRRFDVSLRGGWGYDLDGETDQQRLACAGYTYRSPECRDLYRTSDDPTTAKLMGVNSQDNDDHNGITQVNDAEPPENCRRLSKQGGGNVRVNGLQPGSRICLRTRQDQWAMLIVGKLPASSGDLMTVQVTVIGS